MRIIRKLYTRALGLIERRLIAPRHGLAPCGDPALWKGGYCRGCKVHYTCTVRCPWPPGA